MRAAFSIDVGDDGVTPAMYWPCLLIWGKLCTPTAINARNEAQSTDPNIIDKMGG